MKKALLFAIAALCVSAAQAVTMAWTKTNASGSVTIPEGKAGTSGTLIFTFTGPASFDSLKGSALITFGTSGTLEAAIQVDPKNAAMGRNGWRSGTATAWTANYSFGKLKTNETNVAAIIFNKADNLITLDFYLNGTYHTSAQNEWFWTYTPNNNGNASLWNAVLDDVTIGTGLSGTLAYTTDALTKEELDTIPEPTALALLALGVAGLALKRKVA